MRALRGPYTHKMTELFFFFLIKYQHVADVLVGVLQLCDVCKGGFGGIECHYNSSIFKKCLQKKPLSWKVSFLHLLKDRTLTFFWALGLLLVSKEAEFCDIQSNREFFSTFEFWQKLHRLKFHFYRQKADFWKKCITRKLKWNLKKKLSVVLLSTKFRCDWYTYQLCRFYRSTVRFVTANPILLSFLWTTRFLWKKWKKVHDG